MRGLLVVGLLVCVYLPSLTQAFGFWNETYRGTLPCPIGWDTNRRTKTCYWFNNRNIVPFHRADRKCRRWGGYLVTVNDETENDYIHSKFPTQSNATGASEFGWIGLTNHLSHKFWWVENRREMDWEGMWAPGQPDDKGILKASVCGVISGEDGLWRDETCKSSNPGFGFICEKEMKEDPEPTTPPPTDDGGRRTRRP